MKNLPPVMLKIAAALALLTSATVNAAVSTWNGTTSNPAWTNAVSWSPGIPASGDDVVIADTTGTNALTMNDASHTIGTLTYGTSGTRASAFAINDNVTGTAGAYVLTISNGVVANGNFATAGGSFSIKAPVTIQGDQTWSIGGNQGDPVNDYGVLLTVGASGAQRPLTLNGKLTKTGSGQLCFIGQNVGNGNIVVNQGALKINAGSSTINTVGGNGSITVNSGASIYISRNSGTLNVTKAIVLNDGSYLRFGGNATGQNYFGAPLTFNGTVGIPMYYASMWLDHTNSWSGTINGTITGSGGTITLWGNNSSLSGMLNNNGTFRLKFGSANSSSAGVEYGLNNAAAYYEATNTPILTFGALSGTAGTVRNSYTNAGATATLTVGALNTSRTFGGVLADNTGPLAMVKVGSGTLTLTGVNTLGGGINVSNGAVLLQGSSASAGSGSVSVQSGASFGGSGTAGGAVTVLAGGKIEADGGIGSPGLNVGSLTLGSGSSDITTSSINVYAGGAITNSGALTVNGTNIVNISGAAPAVGVYNLITYSSIGGAGFSGFQQGALPYGVVANLQDSGTALQLNVTAVTVEPGIWVGNVAGAWNLAGGLEWKGATSGNAQPYHDQDVVTFDDSATNFTVNVTANVTPASINVNNSTAYTFSGVGGIIGSTGLAKDGAGTLVLANNNSYSGGTYITNGVVQVGNGGTNGSIAGDILDEGSLVFNRSDAAASFAGIISGAGSVEQRGSGKLTLGGANPNTYTGVTTVSAGILATASGTALGDVIAGTTVADGATLDVNSQTLGAEPLTVTGAGVGGIGAIVNNGPADNTTATRFVTLTGPTIFGGATRWDVRDPSPASNPNGGVGAFVIGNNNDLTKVSTNVIAFISVGDTGLRDITIKGGTLTISRSTTLGDPARTLAIYPGATLQFHRTSEFENNVLNKVVVMTNANLAVESNGQTNQFAGSISLVGSNTFTTLQYTNGLNLQGSVTGGGSLTTIGPGALIISGAASYTGGTTLGGGCLQVDGTLGTGAHPLQITSPAVVGGNGTIFDPITLPAGSTLAPGDGVGDVGALTLSGSLVLAAGCSNVFDINKDSTTNDVVRGLTSVALGGTLYLKNVGSTAYAPGDSFKLFYAGGYSGSFSAIVPATPALGLVWVTNSLAVNGTIGVAVLPNPIPLVVYSASSLVSANVNVIFSSAALESTSAEDPTNYKLSTGNPGVATATLISPTNVLLGLEAPIKNSTFTVNVKNVHDTAYVPNVVVTTNVPGIAIGFLEAFRVSCTNGSAFAYGTNGLIKIYSDGADIFGTQDTFEFVYTYLTNDFDVCVMLQSLLITDPAAKAGIMARDLSDPTFPIYDDRHYLVGGFTADSTRNNNFTQYREAEGASAVAPASPRPGATYPTNWLRLKRTGSFFQGFSGPNGLDWTPMTAVDSSTNAPGPYPEVIRVGLAVTAHTSAATTEAIFSNFGKATERGVLNVSVSGGDLILSWQPSAIGATLETTSDLTPPATWAPVSGSTTTNLVSIPIGPNRAFFRLASPIK